MNQLFRLLVFFLGLSSVMAQNPIEDYQKDYYANGQLKSEGRLKQDLAEGLWIYYYESGEKRIERWMKAGKNHGKSLWYHRNGQIGWEENYVDGTAEGTFTYYSADGEIKATKVFKAGREISYTVNGIHQR